QFEVNPAPAAVLGGDRLSEIREIIRRLLLDVAVERSDELAAQQGEPDARHGGQRGDHQGQQRGDQLGAQRGPAGQPPQCLPRQGRLAPALAFCSRCHARLTSCYEEGSRSTYPTPRRVWISRG